MRKPGPGLERSWGGIAIGIDVSLGQALVESIGCDRVAYALSRRGGIVEPVTASDHRLAPQA